MLYMYFISRHDKDYQNSSMRNPFYWFLYKCQVVNFFILVPSGAPEKISLHREGDSSMLLLWSPPRKDQRKGNIIAYQVNINAVLIMTSFVRPMKTQISLGIRPVWSESSLSAWRNLGPLATHWVHSEDSDQTGQMPRLIWVRWAHTHFVGFVMLWFMYTVKYCNWI